MFEPKSVLVLKPNIHLRNCNKWGCRITGKDFEMLKSAPGVSLYHTTSEHQITVRIPGSNYLIRVPPDIFIVDDTRQFKAGELVSFDPKYSIKDISFESSLPEDWVMEMMKSPSPLRVGDREFPVPSSEFVQIFFKNYTGKTDWYWMWRGCLSKYTDFDIVESDCEVSEFDINSIL